MIPKGLAAAGEPWVMTFFSGFSSLVFSVSMVSFPGIFRDPVSMSRSGSVSMELEWITFFGGSGLGGSGFGGMGSGGALGTVFSGFFSAGGDFFRGGGCFFSGTGFGGSGSVTCLKGWISAGFWGGWTWEMDMVMEVSVSGAGFFSSFQNGFQEITTR